MNSATHWNPARLAAFVGIAALLFCSWFFEPGRALWDRLDAAFFWMVNNSLERDTIWTWFWAITNNRMFDLFAVSVVLLLFLSDGGLDKETNFRTRFAQFFSIGVLALIMVQIGKGLPIERASPTRLFDGVVLLSNLVPEISLKDSSGDSFPGDHGVSLFVFAVGALTYLTRSRAVMVVLAGIFFTLPRMMSGGHWLTDEIVGAVSIGIFTAGLFWHTPLQHLNDTVVIPKLEGLIDRVFQRINRLRPG